MCWHVRHARLCGPAHSRMDWPSPTRNLRDTRTPTQECTGSTTLQQCDAIPAILYCHSGATAQHMERRLAELEPWSRMHCTVYTRDVLQQEQRGPNHHTHQHAWSVANSVPGNEVQQSKRELPRLILLRHHRPSEAGIKATSPCSLSSALPGAAVLHTRQESPAHKPRCTQAPLQIATGSGVLQKGLRPARYPPKGEVLEHRRSAVAAGCTKHMALCIVPEWRGLTAVPPAFGTSLASERWSGAWAHAGSKKKDKEMICMFYSWMQYCM